VLSLNSPIGKGKHPGVSVKACINLDRQEVLLLVEKREIELDGEALQYMERGASLGTIDYGTRNVDFFPHNNYVLDGKHDYTTHIPQVPLQGGRH